MQDESTVTGNYETIGRFIYAFHRHANPDQLRLLPGTTWLAPELSARGAALAQRFDAVLAGSVVQPDQAVLDAILADLQAFVQDSGWTHAAT